MVAAVMGSSGWAIATLIGSRTHFASWLLCELFRALAVASQVPDICLAADGLSADHHLENPQPLYSLEKTSCSTECARRKVHRMAPDVAQGSADCSEGFAVLGSPVHLI